jgi:hypothetical protein
LAFALERIDRGNSSFGVRKTGAYFDRPALFPHERDNDVQGIRSRPKILKFKFARRISNSTSCKGRLDAFQKNYRWGIVKGLAIALHDPTIELKCALRAGPDRTGYED